MGVLLGWERGYMYTYLGTKTKIAKYGEYSCLGACTIGEDMSRVWYQLVNVILKGREPGRKESGTAYCHMVSQGSAVIILTWMHD